MPEPFGGFVIGGLLGAFATMMGTYFVHRMRRRHRAADLRVAFRTELEELAYLDDYVEAGNYEALTGAVEPSAVYRANADELGRLDDDEVAAIVAFYTDLDWLRDQEDIEDKKERVHEIQQKRERALAALEGG